MKKIKWIVIVVFSMCLAACNGSGDSDKCKKLTIKRFDLDVFAIDTANISAELHRLQPEYGVFLDGADLDDELTQLQILNLIEDPVSKAAMQDVKKKYYNLDFLEKQLTQAFSIYNEAFGVPDTFPSVYAYISGFDYVNRVIFEQNTLLIDLEMYLGESAPYYAAQGIPQYLIARLDSQFIALDAMRAFANERLTQGMVFKTLLDHTIYQGKILYFLTKVLPSADKAVLAGFTEEQWKWCEKNELLVWTYFIQNNLLFEQDYYAFKNFINDGPTTPVFPGSPSRISSYIGYKMIEKLVDKQNLNLKEVFEVKNAQEVLQKSGYKGK